MIVPKQDIAFFFGAVNQAKTKRGLAPGELIEAINVRQIVEDEYRKRPGYDRTVPAAESGSLTTPWESFVFEGRSKIARDGAGVVWRQDGSTWRNRGTAVRAYPTVRESNLVNAAEHPTIVYDGASYWVFVVGTNSFTWLIYDTSGNITRTPATQTATNIRSLTAVSNGTYVWVLWTASGTNSVSYVRFTVASPSTAPTTGTYGTNVATTWNSIDSHKLANGDMAVAVLSHPTNGNTVLWVSYLDPATSQEDASPASVTTTLTNTGTAISNYVIRAVSILTSDGSNGSWYATFWGEYAGASGSAGDINLKLATITASNLATATATVATEAYTVSLIRGFACGYLADNGDRVIYASTFFTSSPTFPYQWTLKRHVYTGSTVTTTLRRYSYPVSKPQKVGSTFYLLTGYDDGPDTGALRSYFLIDSSGNIVSQIAYALASSPGNQALPDSATPTADEIPHIAGLLVNGNKLETALLINAGSGASTVNDYAPAFVSLDLGATYSAPSRLRDGIAGWPAGVPFRAGTSDNIRELALMLSPIRLTLTAGGGAALAGPTVVQYLYRMLDADGAITRSAPCPAQSTTFTNSGAQVVVQPLTHMLPGVTAQIEIYLSEVNSTQPFLHTVVANDTSVDTITVNVTPQTINTANETIYTFGGGLENSPLPEAKFVALWRNRTIVGSTREIWPSIEHEAGFGPRWNEALVTVWAEGEGDILAGCPVDWNYFAVFKRNAVAVISGGGPNVTAGGGVAGNYEAQTIPVAKGPVNARSVLTGPQGAFFQSTGDGRIYCVTAGLTIADVSDGMESYRTGTVQATNYVEKDRQLHFHMDDGAIMVLDIAHPTPTNQFGRWTRWTSSGLNAACGALVDATGTPAHLETSTGAVRTPGSGFEDATASSPASVFMALTTGDLAASGKIKGVFRIDQVNVLGEWLSTNTAKLTVTSDYGTVVTPHTTSSLAAAPEEIYARPQGHDRAQSVRLKVEETVSTGEGFVFTGISLTVQPYGMAKFPQANRRVA